MKNTGSNTHKDILKIPEPKKQLTSAERDEAYIEAFNAKSSDTKIVGIKRDKAAGEITIILESSPEAAAIHKRKASVRLHDPDDMGKQPIVTYDEREVVKPAKNWSAAERKRRMKEALKEFETKDRQ